MTPPVRMEHHEKMRMRAAAFRALKLFPGPIGELLSREILTWEEFGYRFGSSSLIWAAVDRILKMPSPSPVQDSNHLKSAVGYE